MRPSAPIASDPNAVYRAAIAAFADNRVVVADDMNPIEAANAHYQESAFAQLQRLGSTRADSLNRIASTRDPGALRAVEQITAPNTTPAQPPMRCPEAVNSAAYPAEPSRAQAAPWSTQRQRHSSPPRRFASISWRRDTSARTWR